MGDIQSTIHTLHDVEEPELVSKYVENGVHAPSDSGMDQQKLIDLETERIMHEQTLSGLEEMDEPETEHDDQKYDEQQSQSKARKSIQHARRSRNNSNASANYTENGK